MPPLPSSNYPSRALTFAIRGARVILSFAASPREQASIDSKPRVLNLLGLSVLADEVFARRALDCRVMHIRVFSAAATIANAEAKTAQPSAAGLSSIDCEWAREPAGWAARLGSLCLNYDDWCLWLPSHHGLSLGLHQGLCAIAHLFYE